jgi:hypothetical protein
VPIIATCQRCTACFVNDEATGEGSLAKPAESSHCERCRRETVEERLRNNQTSFLACVGATMYLAASGLKAGMHPRPGAGGSWEGFLGMAIACGVLGAFYYLFRVRPQKKLVAADLRPDEVRRESPDIRRRRMLREAGHAIDWIHEQRVLRRQSERLTENLVDLGELSYGELRQERRHNRLHDRIDEVDERLRLARESVETSAADQAALDKLERRRSCLMAELARPPSVWPRIIDGSVSLFVGFWELFFVGIYAMVAFAAFRAGKFGIAALIVAVLLVKCLPVDAWWLAWRCRPGRPLASAVPDDMTE